MKQETYSQKVYVYQLKCFKKWNLDKEKILGI